MQSSPYAGEFLGDVPDVTVPLRARGDRSWLGAMRSDHLGVLLAYLALVAEAEADAVEDGNRVERERMADQSAQFIDRTLASWLPSYLAGALEIASGFWASVLTLTWDVVYDHRISIARPPEAVPVTALPLDVYDPQTGLREVAEFLASPARCGLYVARADVLALGRSAEAPCGFGPRVTLIVNLLRSAADYGSLRVIAAGVRGLVERRRRAIERLSRELTRTVSSPWCARMDATLSIVGTIEAAADVHLAGSPAAEVS
jgi:hypothetical protein